MKEDLVLFQQKSKNPDYMSVFLWSKIHNI